MACTLVVWTLKVFCQRFVDCSMGRSWNQGRGYTSPERYVQVKVFLGPRSRWGSLSTKEGSLSCLGSVVGVGWSCDFAIFAASRETVVHGTHRFLRGRMNLVVQMLCNVAFRQCTQIEVVAKLFFNGYDLGSGFEARLSFGHGVGTPFCWLFGYDAVFRPFVCYLLCTDVVVPEVLGRCSVG